LDFHFWQDCSKNAISAFVGTDGRLDVRNSRNVASMLCKALASCLACRFAAKWSISSSFTSASMRNIDPVTDSQKEFVVVSSGAVLLLADGHLLCSAGLRGDLACITPYG